MKTVWYLLNFQNPFTYILLSAIKGYWDDTSTKEKVAQTQSEGGGFLPLWGAEVYYSFLSVIFHKEQGLTSLGKAMMLFHLSSYPLISFPKAFTLCPTQTTSAERHELFHKFLLSVHLLFAMGDARVLSLLASSPIP